MAPAETRTSDIHELRKGLNPIFAALRRGNQAWFRRTETLVARRPRRRLGCCPGPCEAVRAEHCRRSGAVRARTHARTHSGSLSARHGPSRAAHGSDAPSQVPGRLAQRESASLTRKRPQVQILYRPPGKTPPLALENQVSGPTACRASRAVRPDWSPARASAEPSQTRRPRGPDPWGSLLSRRRSTRRRVRPGATLGATGANDHRELRT
jgi:hypothetical protein